jgi:UDP-N-acetylmuramoylalanine--D-glutamate ligase
MTQYGAGIELRDKHVTVMGLGLHGGGVGIVRWLVGQGAKVTVTDLRTADVLRPSLEALAGLPVRYVLGGHQKQDFIRADLILRNPGVPRESPFLLLAQEHGVPVLMEMGLFFRLCPAPIIAITGTKGKSTTTSLLGAMIRRERPDAVVAGNLAGGSPQWHGAPPALELLPDIKPDTPVILELSSWQLEGLPPGVSPHLACVTNVLPDHLNRYRDMADYTTAKKPIFLHQAAGDTVVLNYDNAVTCGFATEAPGRVAWFSVSQHVVGMHVDADRLTWLSQGQTTGVAALADLHLPGRHNLENALAAAALAMSWGCQPADIAAALRDFAGVPHRLETVAEIDGVRYVNDSAATTPEATLAALAALPDSAPVILIAGGSHKGLSFGELARGMATRVKAVVILEGTASDGLEAALRAVTPGQPPIAGRFGSLSAALEVARGLASPGDVVLLSPASASFGLFANEFQRGDQFRDLVQRL